MSDMSELNALLTAESAMDIVNQNRERGRSRRDVANVLLRLKQALAEEREARAQAEAELQRVRDEAAAIEDRCRHLERRNEKLSTEIKTMAAAIHMLNKEFVESDHILDEAVAMVEEEIPALPSNVTRLATAS